VVYFGPAKTLAIPMSEYAYSRSGFLSREIRGLPFQRVVAAATVLHPFRELTDRLSEAQDTALLESAGTSR
jgi:hypothetical protein